MDVYSAIETDLHKMGLNPDDKTILSNISSLTEDYIVELSENSKCIKKLLNDISVLKVELRDERSKLKALEKELGNSVGWRWFNSFTIVTLERESTQMEWSKFYNEIINGIEFSKFIYKWIENNVSK